MSITAAETGFQGLRKTFVTNITYGIRLSGYVEGHVEVAIDSARRQEIATEYGFEAADGEDSDYIRKQCALFFERENIHDFQVLHLSITDNSDSFWIMRKGTRRSILLYFSY